MNRKSLIYLFLVPLLIACYGVWQHYRVSDITGRVDFSNALIQEATTALQKESNAVMEFSVDGENYRLPARELINNERQLQSQYATEIMLAQLQSKLAGLAVGLALLCLVLNAGALALCRRSVTVAKRSQDDLVRAFDRCRKLLPWLMVSQIVICGLAFFCAVVYETLWFGTHFKMNAGGIKVMFFALMVLFGILWVLYKSLGSLKQCFALFQPEPHEVAGHNLTREQAPELWRWVEALAQRLGAIVPDNIVVGLLEGFYVTANPVQVEDGPLLKGQTLYFPLTWAALMDEEELSAVVGHELGHFVGQDTLYSLRFAPLYAGISHSIETMVLNQRNAPVLDHVILYPSLHIGIQFIQQLHETVSHWSRIREHEADAIGARASSARALATSLLRISAISEAQNRVFEAFFNGKLQSDNLVENVVADLRENGFSDPQQYLESETAHPTDSHPPSRKRIEALGCALDASLLAQATRPAADNAWQSLTPLLPQAAAMAQNMTHELDGKVTRHREAFRRELEEVVGQAGESVTLYTGNKVYVVGGFLAAILFVASFILLTQLSFNYTGEPNVKMVAGGAAMGLLGLLACWSLWQQWRKRHTPFLTLTPQTLRCRQFTDDIPLNVIDDFKVQNMNHTITVTLICKEGYELPRAVGGWWKNRTRVQRSKKRLMFTWIGKLRGEDKKAYSTETLLELFIRNLNAIHARETLNTFK